MRFAFVGTVAAILLVAAMSSSWAGSIPARDADDQAATTLAPAPAAPANTYVAPAPPAAQATASATAKAQVVSRPVYVNRTVVVRTQVRPRVYKYTTKVVRVQSDAAVRSYQDRVADDQRMSWGFISDHERRIGAVENKAEFAVQTADEAKDIALRGKTGTSVPNAQKEGKMNGIMWLVALGLLVIAILVGMAISRLIARDANESRREMARDASGDAHDSAETAMSRWNVRGVRVRRSGSFAADFFNQFGGHAPVQPAVAYAPVAPTPQPPAGGVVINNYNGGGQPSGWHSPNAPQPAAGHVPVQAPAQQQPVPQPPAGGAPAVGQQRRQQQRQQPPAAPPAPAPATP